LAKSLIIVESPAKAKTIAKYLGKDYVVESSIGHIRDLPSSADEIPAAYKKKPWARTGVDVENNFKPLYIVPADKKAQVKKLKDLLEDATTLYLATDEDREGEAIAWHLKEVLDPQVPTKRMVFHEITESAIKAALKSPRDIDEKLVDAQEARRILDRLYGYEVSPILWRKVAPRLSAGRVQSVATRLCVERERLRIAFKSGDYWDIKADLAKRISVVGAPPRIRTDLVEISGKRIATGKDFDPNSGQLSEAAREKVVLLQEKRARELEEALAKVPFTVSEVTKKPFTERPYAPFITSSLQMEANKKLRFTAQRTMRAAQRLYESGFITYMRTDSTTLSAQAINAARTQIEELYGKEYLPDAPRTYEKKAKGAQEAHEAIRPAGESFKTPESVKADLDEDQFRLYDLIWKRTVASQMKDAHGERTQVRFIAKVDGDEALFQAGGKVIQFPGFLRAYVEGSDDPDAELEDQEKVLPPVEVGDVLDPEKVVAEKHSTQPPARYTEASLVKELEDRGIGRPSTYASIIGTIQDRGYVFKKGSALVPTFTAFAVINLLEQHFKELVDYAFTASMETDLDAISEGEKKAAPWLKTFYFGESTKKKPNVGKDVPLLEIGLKGKVSGGIDDIDPRLICEMPLGFTDDKQLVAARVGRYGPYVQIGDTSTRANIPEDTAPDELDVKRALELLKQAGEANRAIGVDPASGKNIYLKSGRFGPYVQLGELELNDKGKAIGEKPRMASLWPGMTPKELTLEQALQVLSFPKLLGEHPVHKAPITVHDGKFGPYVSMSRDGTSESPPIKETRSLPDRAQMTTLTLEEAIKLVDAPRQNRGRQAGPAQAPLATMGTSNVTGQPVVARMGRFGAYVTDGVVNATVPSSRDPAKLTLEDAMELIAQREQKLREQGIDPRAPKKGGSGGRRGRGRPGQTLPPRKAAAAPKAAKVAKAKPAATTTPPTKATTKKPAPAKKPVAVRKPAKAASTTKKKKKKRG
jgi:DNA topoisomerase I